MNTPIISISEDQNTITHESGNVYVAEKLIAKCLGCAYLENHYDCIKIPCLIIQRQDGENKIFKLKQP